MATRFKVGDIITVIDTNYERGTVEIVGKVGRRYLWNRRADYTGERVADLFQVDLESGSTLILPGDRPDVVERLTQLRRQEADAHLQRKKDREEAKYQFGRQWEVEHPTPTDLVRAYILELQKEATDGN